MANHMTVLYLFANLGGPSGLRDHGIGLFLILSRGGKREYAQNLAGKNSHGNGNWRKIRTGKTGNGNNHCLFAGTGTNNTV